MNKKSLTFKLHTLHHRLSYPQPIYLLYTHIHHRHSTHTHIAFLFQPHTYINPSTSSPDVLTALPPLIASLFPTEENVSLHCFLITGTMQHSAVTRPPYQQHNTKKSTQCDTLAPKCIMWLSSCEPNYIHSDASQEPTNDRIELGVLFVCLFIVSATE